MYWFEKNGREADVYISSRVRFARNLEDYPCEPILCETGAREIIEKVRGALSDGYAEKEITEDLSEKHVISREFVNKKGPKALFVNDDTDVYTMVCEEDHLRIQCVKPGLDIKGAFEGATECDMLIDEKLSIAFDEKLGYLTHCPTNLGTGMRASVMMHLPALTATNRLRGLEAQLSKLGFTVRGCHGEGSEALGCLYQISNSSSLGHTEEEIIESLERCAESVAKAERDMRGRLERERGDALRDKIMRSLGIARHAYMIDTAELYSLYSDIRLGISLGYIEKNIAELDRALLTCQRATLTGGRETTAAERDKKRAAEFALHV